MPKSDQGVSSKRYQVIPRTLIFVTHENKVLLLKGAATKRLWANRYNGLGGHIERGEDVYSAAVRELAEEAGIRAVRLTLVGTLMVDASDEVGICIYIFRGEYAGEDLVSSSEGTLEWVRMDRLDEYPLVEDLKTVLPRVLSVVAGRAPISGRSYYDEDDQLVVVFSE